MAGVWGNAQRTQPLGEALRPLPFALELLLGFVGALAPGGDERSLSIAPAQPLPRLPFKGALPERQPKPDVREPGRINRFVLTFPQRKGSYRPLAAKVPQIVNKVIGHRGPSVIAQLV